MKTEVLEIIAKSPYKDNLLEYLRDLQDYVADVRNGDYDPQTRLQTVEVLERQLIQKLISLSDGVAPAEMETFK